MKLTIDIPHRYACMRSHTATHLLHAELIKIFPQTKQAGSYVGPDELRFDFFADRGLTNEELASLTKTINDTITHTLPVSVEEMSYKEALKTGAKAFFEDTYPEIVRVVSIGSGISVELCGGTHVTETGQIGAFAIIEQTAVAAGVKRITALTGPKVAAHLQEVQTQIESIAQKISVPTKQLDAKIDKILTETQEMKAQIEQLSTGLIQNIIWTSGCLGSTTLDAIWSYEDSFASLGLSFADVVTKLRGLTTDKSWLLASMSGQYALFHPAGKTIAKELGLKGGGSESFVQGRDEKIIHFIEL